MKRDLHADLALCEAATPGPWRCGKGESGVDPRPAVLMNFDYEEGEWYVSADFADLDEARFAAESREGWPEAIRRAIAAEAEVVRLRATLAQIATYGGIDMRGATCAQAAKDALDSISPVYDDVTESHRWLKELVSALDDGRLQQTRMSSGTDYVIQGAREWVRKLDSEVTADVD